MKNYELLYIIHPDLEGDLEKVIDKVKNLIKGSEGNVTKEDIWGRRRLAYSIARNDFGIYVVLNFALNNPKELPSLEEELKHIEGIIRYLLVVGFKTERRKEEAVGKAAVESGPKKERPKKEEKKVKKEEKEKPEKEPKKKEKGKKEELSEKERIKEIDKKLDEILGKE